MADITGLKTMYRCTKTYGHELGLSCVFRQHKAKSHCKFIHGYALGFRFVFACNELDENGWVVDFGSLKPLKEWLQDTFDHKLLVAAGDPVLDDVDVVEYLCGNNLAHVILVERTGCEAFAKLAYDCAQNLVGPLTNGRAHVVSCECMEHGANSATYLGDGT